MIIKKYMAEEDALEDVLTSRKLLTRNAIWNLIGQILPLLAAIVVIPLLIGNLGTERFGIITLIWIVLGYFNLFDFGIGRALTKLIAEKLGTVEESEIPQLVWTALLLMILLGLLGLLLMFFAVPWLTQRILEIPIALRTEALVTFYLLATAIPILVCAGGLRGILEANQRFGLINLIRVPMGIFIFLGPLLILPFTQSLVAITTLLLIARLCEAAAYLLLSLKAMPILRTNIKIRRAAIKPLMRFGSWMTVTNIVGPLMTYLDRFLVGAFISVSAVAYYATPYEAVSRLGIIPAAFVGVLFPAFSASFAKDKYKLTRIFYSGTKYTFLIVFPLVLTIVIFAHEGLEIWLGFDFAQKSERILQLLAIGRLFNCLAQIPFGFIQGIGRPDITAKLHLFELPFYIVALWWLTGSYGLNGVAIVWVLRTILDFMLLFAMSSKFLLIKPKLGRVGFTLALVTLSLAIGFVPMSLVEKTFLSLFSIIIFALISWFYFIDESKKRNVIAIFGRTAVK